MGRGKPCTDHLGHEFSNAKEMCKYWNISYDAYRCRILYQNWDLETTLTTPVQSNFNKCTDHLGNEFESIKDMCQYWNISRDVYRNRQKLDWDLERILTTPMKISFAKDHLGNEFGSETQMYKYWGISRTTAKYRESLGWNLEQILTTPIQSNFNKCTDHLGNEFESETEMYKYWNIPVATAGLRKAKAWNLEQILTRPVQEKYNKCTDHLGNKFKCEKDMCKYWNLSFRTYVARRKRGWNLESSLTTSLHERNNKCTDHLGNEFESETEMYKHWNIPVRTAEGRKYRGWNLEQILTTPYLSVERNKLYTDPVTLESLSLKDLANKYNIHKETLRNRVEKCGVPLIRSLSISIIINSKYLTINKTKYNLTVVKRIKLGKDVFECYIDNGDGTSTFRIMSYDMIDEYCLEQYKKLHNL